MNSSPSSPTGKFAKTRSFPAVALLAWLLCLAAPLHAQYAGNYSGTAWGDLDGVWSMTVAGSGAISGRIVEEDEGLIYPVSGAVDVNGDFTLVVSGFPSASFSGTIYPSGSVDGSWNDPSLGASGDFEGSRLPAGISPYAGSYWGTATGDLTGTWTATVNSVGNWDGTGVTSSGSRYRIAGIVGATGYIDVCIQEGGAMNGQIDASGYVEGEWYDFWDEGTFVGWRINPNGPEIVVELTAGTGLTDGATWDLGTSQSGKSNTQTFTIINRGAFDLTGLAITKNGTHDANFTVGALGATSLTTGGSTTFTVTFTPSAAGSCAAAIHIASNDDDENPFDINLTGTATVPSLMPGELVAPQIAITGGNVNLTVQPSVAGRSYQLQVSDTMAPGTWQDVGAVRMGDGNNLVISIPYVPEVRQRFYRLALVGVTSVPDGFALIPAGSFQMGDQSNPLVGYSDELPVHTVNVSAFYMATHETTKELWDAVRAWGLANGYTDLATGNGGYASKGANHPVHSISWYDMVKWCNARSQKENLNPCYTVGGLTYKTGQNDTPVCNWSANGYRLPTEAEWEKAACGGESGKLFPWGTNTITHSQGNYYSSSSYAYDVSPTRGYHPTYYVGGSPYSSPVGSFAPNGYGFYDMAGNVWELCWDWYGSYAAGAQTDPRGSSSGSNRVVRGSGWNRSARDCRVACRNKGNPADSNNVTGFRVARSVTP